MAEDRHRWAEPGVEEVAEGIFRCPLPLPGDALRAVNAYLVRMPEGMLLIDCGWDRRETHGALRTALRHLGSRPADVRAIFATHVHRDHLGAAAWVKQRSGAWLSLGLGDQATQVAFAADPGRARQASLDRLLSCSAADVVARLVAEPRVDEAPWKPPAPDLYLVGQELLFPEQLALQVIATPGHTRGHLCLFDQERSILFAGDHVLPHITPSLGVELPLADSPLANFMTSLERVRELPAQLVLPAHGPAFSGLRQRVDELLQHHRERLQLCLEQIPAQGATPREVAGALTWTRRGRRFGELDPFNQMLAVFESEAHLRVLADQGRLLFDGEAARYLPGGTPAAATQ